MVNAGILPSVLEAHHVFYTFDDTYCRPVATHISANRTYFRFGYIMTFGTIAYALTHVDYSFAQSNPGAFVSAKYVKREPQSGLTAYAWKSRKFCNRVFKKS